MVAIDPSGCSHEAMRKWKQILRKIGKRRALEILIPPLVDELRRVSAADDEHFASFAAEWEHLAYLPMPTARASEVIEVLGRIRVGHNPTNLQELIDAWDGYFRGVRNGNELPFSIAQALLKCALPGPSYWNPILRPALWMLHAQNPAAADAVMRALCDCANVSFDGWFSKPTAT